MKVAEQIRQTIKTIPESVPFGYLDLGIESTNFFTAAKALERLQKSGVIKKATKGVFYVPRKTVFGELGPESNEILKRYIFKNGKRIAYETGYSLYNRLGLTTQVSSKTILATKGNPIKINIGTLRVSSVKSYAEITDQNYQLLGYLDVLKNVKKIPDCSVVQAIKRMSFLINDLTSKKKNELIKFALFYPARVRALLGAILENINNEFNLEELKNSLNPLTTIDLKIKSTDLPTIKNWNIK